MDIALVWDDPNTDVGFATVCLENVWNDSTEYSVRVHDTTCIINMRSFPNMTYRVGVSLTDSAGNVSPILWSDSESNVWGKFVICKDTVIPLRPTGIKAGKI